MSKIIQCAAALTAGNFVYQWMQIAPDWVAAVDRSFFQTLAVVCFAMIWARKEAA